MATTKKTEDNDTFTLPMGEREILFKAPTDAQLLVLGRMMKVVEGLDGEEQDKVRLQGAMQKISRVLDVIDSMVVNPADRDWLEDQIVAGKLDMGALSQVFDPDNLEQATNRATKRAAAKKTTSRARKS